MVSRARQVHLEGDAELDRMASRIAPRQARNVARGTVHKIAGDVRDSMRQRAPKNDGTLRKAIHSRRRRGTPTEAISDVRIAHGTQAKHDAWYWHFVEFGTVKVSAQPYIQPTVDEFEPKIPKLYRDEFGKRLEKTLEKEHQKQGVKR